MIRFVKERVVDMTEDEYRAFQKKLNEAKAMEAAESGLAGTGTSSGAIAAMPGIQNVGAKTRPDTSVAVSAGAEAPGSTIFLVALVICFGWWFSSALFCAEDAKAYTLCMGANFTLQIIQALVYAPAVLVLALLGVEFGMAIATICHKRGICAAPSRPKIEGVLFALAVFCLGCSLMAHNAVRLAANFYAGKDAPVTIAADMPLKQMLILSVIAYVVTAFFFTPVALKAKTYIGRLFGYVIAFVVASFMAMILYVVVLFVVIAVIVVLALFFMPIPRYVGPWGTYYDW